MELFHFGKGLLLLNRKKNGGENSDPVALKM